MLNYLVLAGGLVQRGYRCCVRQFVRKDLGLKVKRPQVDFAFQPSSMVCSARVVNQTIRFHMQGGENRFQCRVLGFVLKGKVRYSVVQGSLV